MYLLRNIDIKIYYTEAKRQLQKEEYAEISTDVFLNEPSFILNIYTTV